MKKLIIAVLAVIVLAPMFTACNKGENKCYKVKYYVPTKVDTVGGLPTDRWRDSIKHEGHKWITEKDMDIYKSSLSNRGYRHIDIQKVDSIKTLADCCPPGSEL